MWEHEIEFVCVSLTLNAWDLRALCHLSSSWHATWFSLAVRGSFFQKNWQSLNLLSIFELQVKQIWQYYCQCRFSLGLGTNIGLSIILHNYPPSQSFYFPAQFYSKITLCFFFCTLHLNRASGRSWKKMSIFAGFSGTNSRKKWPISREFCWNFRGQFIGESFPSNFAGKRLVLCWFEERFQWN